MQELIKVTEENGEQLVSARELHKFLESKQDFTHWIKSRIEKYGFIEDEDFTIILTKSGGRPQSDYILKVDISKEISMVEGNERGSQARKYFILCEKRLKLGQNKIVQSSYMIEDPIKRAEKWIEEQKEHQLALQVKQNEIEYKENLIIGLVEDIDLSTKRQRITQIVRHNSKNYQDRYNLLYKEFEKKYHCDLGARLENYNNKNKPKMKNRMDYIDRVMNKIPQLYELTCKIFENDVESLKKQWFDIIEDKEVI